MQTSGVFTTAQHTVNLARLGQAVTLSPFSDVHREAKHHCGSRWKEYLEYARGLDKPVFWGGGDYHDFGSASERRLLQKGALHSDSDNSIRDMLVGRCHDFIKEIEFMQPNLVGLIGGNHDMDLRFGQRTITMTEYLCECLEVPFLGVSCLARVNLDYHGSQCSVDTFTHHGLGAGRTKGASLNKVYAMRDTAQAECFFMGHDHGLGVWPGTIIKLDGQMRIVEVEQLFCRMGSFLKAYEPGDSNYNVDSGRGPSSLGWVSVDLHLKRDRSKDGRGLWIDKTATVH